MLKLFLYSVWWRYSSENFEEGIIKAESIEDAEKRLKKIYPECIGCNARDIEFDEDDICIVYSK